MDRAKKIEVMLEFLIFGIVIGVVEDVVAVKVVSGEPITWQVLGIIVLIAIPFAVLGEIVADNIDFAQYIRKFISEDKDTPEEKNKSIIDSGQKKKRKNLVRLRNYIEDKDSITNDDVEELLGVSDATATRYLNELEDEGLIEERGEGRGTSYIIK